MNCNYVATVVGDNTQEQPGLWEHSARQGDYLKLASILYQAFAMPLEEASSIL